MSSVIRVTPIVTVQEATRDAVWQGRRCAWDELAAVEVDGTLWSGRRGESGTGGLQVDLKDDNETLEDAKADKCDSSTTQ